MSGITEWLANLSWQTVVIVIIVLLGLRYALLRQGSPAAKSVAETAESLAIAMGLVFLIIRPLFVQAFFIPSESMVPTLLVQDHILVNKTVYHMRDPRPGDIVVFKAPPEAVELSGAAEGRSVDYIKRVIAVPGDEIYIRPGYITVNGERWNHDDIRNAFADPDDSVKVKSDAVLVAGKRLTAGDLSRRFGGDREIEFHPGFVVRNGERVNEPYLAEDPDIAYPIVEPQLSEPGTYQSQRSVRKAISDGSLKMIRNSGPTRVKLGPGELLVMGDNRNRSSDSRFWGPLDRDRVMGRAMFVFWPISRIKWIR